MSNNAFNRDTIGESMYKGHGTDHTLLSFL